MQIKDRQSEVGFSNSDDLHPLLQRIYASRGITNRDELEYSLRHLLAPELMSDIENAVA